MTMYPSGPKSRARDLERWIERHRSVYTGSALESSAIEAGYTHEEFEAALASVEARAPEEKALQPIRTNALRIVLIAYGLTWVLFAIPLLARETLYGMGPLEQVILTITLGIALLISWGWTRSRRVDPARPGAITVLLSVPLVLLLVVGGLCVPFVPTS